MKISFTTYVFREKKMYVAYAPELDISSCGHTAMEARKNIEEAVELFLEEAKKNGTLSQILEEAGFIKNRGEWESSQFIAVEKKEVVFA